MKVRWAAPVLTVLILGLAVWQVHALLRVLTGAEENRVVETAVVGEGPFVVGITRDGQVTSADVVSVRAPRSGSTVTWLIDDGSDVVEGDLIAKVDVSEYVFRVESSRLEYQKQLSRVEQTSQDKERDLQSAQMSVEQFLRSLQVLGTSHTTEVEQGAAQIGYDRWNLNWAQGEHGKQQGLAQGGIVPSSAVEQAARTVRSREYGLARSETALDYVGAEQEVEQSTAENDVDAARFNVQVSDRRKEEAITSAERRARMSKESLDDQEEQLAGGEVRAPTAGVVVLGKTWSPEGRRTLREGDRIRHRMKVCDITNLSDLAVQLHIEESAASELEVGQETEITVKRAPGRRFGGEIAAIGAVAREVHQFEDPNAVPNQRTFDVTVKVLDADPELLRPGVSAKVQFVFERVAKAVSVPVEAVHDRPEGQVVYVRKGDGFQERRVELGKRNDEMVMVTKGLSPGEVVALADPGIAGTREAG